MQYDKCPNCGNESIVNMISKQYEEEYSVKTGKCIKKSKYGETVYWLFKCKCGWKSEICTE